MRQPGSRVQKPRSCFAIPIPAEALLLLIRSQVGPRRCSALPSLLLSPRRPFFPLFAIPSTASARLPSRLPGFLALPSPRSSPFGVGLLPRTVRSAPADKLKLWQQSFPLKRLRRRGFPPPPHHASRPDQSQTSAGKGAARREKASFDIIFKLILIQVPCTGTVYWYLIIVNNVQICGSRKDSLLHNWMDASTTHMIISNIHPAFPLLLGKQVLAAFSMFLILTFLTLTGISLVIKEPHHTCEDIQILQGVQGTRAVTGKAFSYPISPFACRGKITYYEITLANDSTLSKWLEYNISTNILQGKPLMEKSEEFHLAIVAYGMACKTPTTNADFALQDRICIHEKNICQSFNSMYFGAFSICSGSWYAKHISITFAEIILYTKRTLEIREQLNLICTMAEYLHLDPSSLTLIPVKDSFNKYFQNLTILAEDIRYINSTKSHYVGLYWPVGFGVFALLSELVQVLRHNVESNNLSQLLGYEIAGWRVLKQGYEKRYSKKWQKRKMATPKLTWRPTKTQTFTVLTAALPQTRSVIKSEASSSLFSEAISSVIPPHMDIITQLVTIKMDLETIQANSPIFTIFQYLSSELSPSLILSSTEFENKETFGTPPISEHILYKVSQDDFPTPQKSEPKDNSTFYYLGLFMPTTKNHFSNPVHHKMDIPPEEISSKPSSPEHFSGEIRNLNYHSPFKHLTASRFISGDIISIIKLSLTPMSTLTHLRASSSELPFSSVAVSLLLFHDSDQNQKLFNVYSYASETVMTLPLIRQIEVPKWNKSSILTNITSEFDASLTNGDFYPKPGFPSNACPPTQLYYSGNAPISSKHDTQLSSISLLTFGLLSKTISIPKLFPSLTLSIPVELTLLFGFSNILPMEKLPDRKQVSSDRMKTHESFTSIPLSYRLVTAGNSFLVCSKTEMDTSLWKKGSHLIYITASSAFNLSSRFLSQEEIYRKNQILELHSYESSLFTQPLELANTYNLYFPMNQYDSIQNLIRTPVIDPDALQLDRNYLSLESSLGTKINFQITRDFVSELMKESAIVSNKGICTETGFHSTTMYNKAQGPVPFVFQSQTIQTLVLYISPLLFHLYSGQPNTPPRVVNAIKWIAATIGHRFSFSVPPETFYDQEDGNSTQLTLGINPIDGSPTDLESWLQFNASDKTMYGYPLDTDFQYSPQEFLLFAIDSGGLKTEDKFIIETFRPTTIPCHIYTVITKNSYHSFLKNRGRINIFLKKLSKYLFADSPGDMILLHLKTGSTVFMWYSKLFCTMTDKCARDEIQDVLTKLGRPMENVNPDFAEAMLPEFKIELIEEVIYAGICSPMRKPTNDSLAINRTVTTFKYGNCLITNTFSALLIGICSTTLAFLIVVHYQKCHKKTFQPQCASVHGRPSCGYIDLEMDMLSSCKSPILEQDVPPSTLLPLPVPVVSQPHSCKTNRGLVISRLPAPPKYSLPPLYGRTDTDSV
ncbi:uncharacterized protein LOC112540813 [Python bivittatus]|uniref:Uncharacterized protein LOC112540813 n=1 Tax=Python bivittatus TaxID=176946 RepID=A0A9F5IFX6_PYTBI|nr:uncharacterized protein LOC112540813 [Python bivittatus]